MRVLTADDETMSKFYESWAFVRSSDQALPQMVSALRPLSVHKYTLSLDYEITRWGAGLKPRGPRPPTLDIPSNPPRADLH